MIAVADLVAGWTPGGGTLGRPALAGTLAMTAGGLWLCLWRGRNRLLGLPVIAVGLVMAPAASRPDVIVAGDGRSLLLVRPDGRLAILGRPDGFGTGMWLASLGDPRSPQDASLVAGVACDPDACVLDVVDGRAAVSLVLRPVAFADECGASRLVVTPLPAPSWCRVATTVIDRTGLEGAGARTYAIQPGAWKGEGPLVLDALERAVPPVRRPWHGD
jgi:competence protein ComEC